MRTWSFPQLLRWHVSSRPRPTSRGMDFDNRGKCLKGGCTAGCTVFIPKSGPSPDSHPGLAQCAVCDGCVVAQHEPPPQAPSKPHPPPPVAPAPSATSTTMNGSRGFAAPPKGPFTGSPFRGHAQDRQESIEGKLQDSNSVPGTASKGGRKFYPAEQSQLNGDLNPNDSKGKKRKHKTVPDSDTDRAEKRRMPAKGVKTPASKAFTVVLAADTKAVAKRKYLKPSAAKLIQLNREGYVKNVNLHGGNTWPEITEAVETAFASVPEMETYGFRVLEVETRAVKTAAGRLSKKQVFGLKPIEGELGMDAWTRYSFPSLYAAISDDLKRALALSTVRGAGAGYRNTIFIALSPAAPNLRFPGIDLTLDEPDRDLGTDSECSEDESTSVATGVESNRADKTGGDNERFSAAHMDTDTSNKDHGPSTGNGPENEKTHSQGASESPPFTGFSGNSETDDDMKLDDQDNHFGLFESPDTSAWDPFPAAHISLLRGLRNITKPDSANQQRWWKSTPLPHLTEFNMISPLLADLIDSTATGQMHVDVFFTKIQKYVVKRLEPMSDLALNIDIVADDTKSLAALRDEFTKLFGVGPGGISIVIPVLSSLYEGLRRIREQRFVMNRESLRTEYLLDETSTALLTCLTHFRSIYDRSLWDPKNGFRELAQILARHDDQLPVGDMQSPMHTHLDGMNLQQDSVNTLRHSLEDAFGSATDPGHMQHTAVVGGEYGLRRFYEIIVEPFLDKINRPDYDDVLKLLNDCSRALARKCANYIKQIRPSQATGRNRSHRLRLVKMIHLSGHFKTPREENDQFEYADELYSDTAEDMTRTESAAEDWYRDLKPGPGIKTRRRRRHTTDHVSSSDSDDYAPPKSKRKARSRPEYVEIETPPPSPPPEQFTEKDKHKKDLADADLLLGLPGWFQLRRRILLRFPHPDAKQRDSLNNLNNLATSNQYKRISTVYHPDRNVTQSEKWREITAKIMTAVNGKRRP
ncbi:hypothetical protein B0H17DRAFT_1142030 [Mycena rosella]|uniref:Uncharacterized protein n=1 Tax=Mycena rosella TaxID=1033263 RepID=A0AAD7CYC1_MYCRO|nr:hypothetical protein B0H17DRAFT_1142030 [Mycena rosella]